MLELPETLTVAKQLQDAVVGKTIKQVLPPTKVHKFCWFQGEAAEYEGKIKGSKIVSASAFGIYVELLFDNGYKLSFNDGVNVRLLKKEEAPKVYQLLIVFDDEEVLAFTVAMYGGIVLHEDNYENAYYTKSKLAVSPFSPEFLQHYETQMELAKPTLSAKAFLATEQRFPGIGNGAVQDILFHAHLHPKRKISTLTKAEKDALLSCIIETLKEMTQLGGRDTEKDLYGNRGKYETKMSKNTLAKGCPVCHEAITKESYLGGSIYYCIFCQPIGG